VSTAAAENIKKIKMPYQVGHNGAIEHFELGGEADRGGVRGILPPDMKHP
jgi:hypothetical protein